MATPVDTIYNQCSQFSIGALTDITGSGGSAFAHAMTMSFEGWVKDGLVCDVRI